MIITEGHFINPKGFDAVLIPDEYKGGRPLYNLRLHEDSPLGWVMNDMLFQPDKTINRSDLGSIPLIFRFFKALRQTRFARIYYFHDSAYRYHGIYVLNRATLEMSFIPISKEDADMMLFYQIDSEGGKYAKYFIYYAVQMFGDNAWRDSYDPKLVNRYIINKPVS